MTRTKPHRVEVAPLVLRPRAAIGAHGGSSARPALLLRIHFQDGLVGHAGLSVWTSLGDPPLPRAVVGLADDAPPPVSARALATARADAEARAEGRWLLGGLQIPRSHGLLTTLGDGTADRIAELRAAGFSTLKIKIGRAPEDEQRELDALAHGSSGLRLRLDANGSFSPERFAAWWSGLGAGTRARVELVEDPCPFEPGDWASLGRGLGVPLAWDRGSEALPERAADLTHHGVELAAIVVKPAVQEPEPLADLARELGCGLIVTSYLGPVVEQVAAAWTAGRLLRAHPDGVLECGLCSHLTFATDPWSSLLAIDDARLVPPPGAGLGFDVALAEQDWRAPETVRWS